MKQRHKPGDTTVSQNGYHYTYVEREGRTVRLPTSWVVGKERYGNYPDKNTRVVFEDGNRSNLEPKNILYVPKVGDDRAWLRRRKIYLEDKIRELRLELTNVNEKLKE